MNENLQDALAGIITKAVEGIDTATSFLQSEIPDVIVQLLHWNFAVSLIWFIFVPLLIVCAAILFCIVIKRMSSMGPNNNVFEADTPLPFFGCLIAGAFFVVTFGTTIGKMNLDWLQIWIAPKVWLIEYAAQLVK